MHRLAQLDWNRVEVEQPSSKLEDVIEVSHDVGANVTCPICCEAVLVDCKNADELPVHPTLCEDHIFHLQCLKVWLKSNASCPLCRKQLIVFTGFQPVNEGTRMIVLTEPHSLPGHDDCNTIRIIFHFESGIQAFGSPLPGEPFQGGDFQTFLPNNSEGQEVLRLLQVAWTRRLLFRVGYNAESGRMDRVILNGLELKYSVTGGIMHGGYPDVSYMSRLKSDLRELRVI